MRVQKDRQINRTADKQTNRQTLTNLSSPFFAKPTCTINILVTISGSQPYIQWCRCEQNRRPYTISHTSYYRWYLCPVLWIQLPPGYHISSIKGKGDCTLSPIHLTTGGIYVPYCGFNCRPDITSVLLKVRETVHWHPSGTLSLRFYRNKV